MKLYHFTAKHHLAGGPGHAGAGIERYGIMPNIHPLIALWRMVWLTEDGSWEQVWSPRVVPGVGCDRTEVRITVTIPKNERYQLRTVEQVLPWVRADWREDFVGGLDLSAWRAYLDVIPSQWMRGVEFRPESWGRAA